MIERKQKIISLVFSIMAIMLAVVGYTFAHFEADEIEGIDSSSTVTTTTIGSITFSGGANFTDNQVIVPGWEKTTTATVTVPASVNGQTIDINLDYTNTFTDIEYKIELVSVQVGDNPATSSNNLVTNTLTSTYTSLPTTSVSQIATLGTISISASTSPIVAIYRLSMRLPENAGNSNMGKEFSGTLYGGINSSSEYYYVPYTNGTNIDPSL